MKAVVSVIGKDNLGILAKVSGICSDNFANIEDVTQSILQDMFVMVMMLDISNEKCNLSKLRDELEEMGSKINMKITVMHEDIFNSMHRI